MMCGIQIQPLTSLILGVMIFLKLADKESWSGIGKSFHDVQRLRQSVRQLAFTFPVALRTFDFYAHCEIMLAD